MSIKNRMKSAWNAFFDKESHDKYISEYGTTFSRNPDRVQLTRGNDRTIITAIYNRIAMDVAAFTFKHCRQDKNERYIEDINSGLNNCLRLEANIDQTSTAFIQDLVLSLLDEGNIAIVPIDTDRNPDDGSFDVETMRIGKITQWRPQSVSVNVYNDRRGCKQDIECLKTSIAIVENPFYTIMNEPNSTLKRLLRKLTLMDIVDEQTSSGKIDLIIQLPYVVKTSTRQAEAEKRRRSLEEQLNGSKYGIGYIDGTEKITQLNRSIENNLLSQIEYLTKLLYSQLGITQSVMDGTASEQEQLNYQNKTIVPIADAIVNAMRRNFLTKTARSQGQTIMYFSNPLKYTPSDQLAELADKLTRNEILSKNEIRQVMGYTPSDDPKADKLINSNIAQKESSEDDDEDFYNYNYSEE